MVAMMSWQDRVVEEARQLDERLGKIELYLACSEFTRLDPMDRERLKAQCRVMRWYSEILHDRIESF
jgi:hypothetical protein